MNAYMVSKEIFKPNNEIDLKKLKEYTNNIIAVYNSDFKDFRRLLFLLDSLDFNIGIHINELNTIDITDFIYNIKGFDIKLGVWCSNIETYNLLTIYKDNFIVGLIGINNDSQIPRFGPFGDIEVSKLNHFDFSSKSIQELKINTDYIKIYNENKLKPIPSTYII